MAKNLTEQDVIDYLLKMEKLDEEAKKLEEQREYIRQYDNSKFGVGDWFGRKDYADLTPKDIKKRITRITIEKAQHHG